MGSAHGDDRCRGDQTAEDKDKYQRHFGVITMVIRLYIPGITEGVYIAILIMNLLSQVSDRIFIEEKFKKKNE